jgi:hypothetical protein
MCSLLYPLTKYFPSNGIIVPERMFTNLRIKSNLIRMMTPIDSWFLKQRNIPLTKDLRNSILENPKITIVAHKELTTTQNFRPLSPDMLNMFKIHKDELSIVNNILSSSILENIADKQIKPHRCQLFIFSEPNITFLRMDTYRIPFEEENTTVINYMKDKVSIDFTGIKFN